jgi:hypothetical protein
MAGSITVSSITLDSDNNFSIKSNTGATLFFANTSGVDIANSIGATAITSDKILSIANTKISGNIISSQITSVANTQITGNIASSQITSNPTLYGNVSVAGTASISASDAIMTIGDNRRTVSTSTTTGAIVSGGGLGVWSDTYIGGNLSVAGGQIKFPASQSASSDGNTLDDYEEGNWTPRNSSGTALSINNTATYIKIGKLVFINADINQLNQDSVYSLPFVVASTGYPGSVTVGYSGYQSQTLNGVFNGSASNLTLYYNGSTGVAPTNGRFILSGCYVASA